MTDHRTVDHSAIRTNQGAIVGLLALAFITNVPLLVAFVAAVLLVGTMWPSAALFQRIYRHVLKPAGLIKPDVIVDNPEPHRFAQGVGGTFALLGFLALLANLSTVGWILVWVVIVLASINLTAGWCAGCTVYYWLNRLGVPGFDHTRSEVS